MTNNPALERLTGLDVKPVRHRDTGVLALAMTLYDQQGNQVGRLIMDRDQVHQFITNVTMVLTIIEADTQTKTPGGGPGVSLN